MQSTAAAGMARAIGGRGAQGPEFQQISKLGVESELIFLRKGRSGAGVSFLIRICLLLIIIIADYFLQSML